MRASIACWMLWAWRLERRRVCDGEEGGPLVSQDKHIYYAFATRLTTLPKESKQFLRPLRDRALFNYRKGFGGNRSDNASNQVFDARPLAR